MLARFRRFEKNVRVCRLIMPCNDFTQLVFHLPAICMMLTSSLGGTNADDRDGPQMISGIACIDCSCHLHALVVRGQQQNLMALPSLQEAAFFLVRAAEGSLAAAVSVCAASGSKARATKRTRRSACFTEQWPAAAAPYPCTGGSLGAPTRPRPPLKRLQSFRRARWRLPRDSAPTCRRCPGRAGTRTPPHWLTGFRNMPDFRAHPHCKTHRKGNADVIAIVQSLKQTHT